MVSAPVWGTGGRRFESCLPDHYSGAARIGTALASPTLSLESRGKLPAAGQRCSATMPSWDGSSFVPPGEYRRQLPSQHQNCGSSHAPTMPAAAPAAVWGELEWLSPRCPESLAPSSRPRTARDGDARHEVLAAAICVPRLVRRRGGIRAAETVHSE